MIRAIASRLAALCLMASLTAGLAVSLTACGAGDEAAPGRASTPPVASDGSRAASVGRATYVAVCAGCHASGQDGAPVMGDASSWTNRSPLWQAVLSEHAKAGYLEMPARGGEATLSDASVSAAVDYMLGRTFPDRLPD